MGFAIGILILIIGILLAIGLHEIGHLVPAKRFGVKVPQYFIGFGPTLWSSKRGETEYGIKAFPLGGYVRLAGMYPPARGEPARDQRGRLTLIEEARTLSREELGPGEENRAFSSLTVPRKLIVMFGGPVMNWLLALLALLIIFVGLGVGAATTRVAAVSECVPQVGVSECAPGAQESPAAAAGLLSGDRIISWAGIPVETWTDVQEAIRTGPSAQLPVVIEREGTERTLTVTPVMTERPVLDDAGQAVVENGETLTTEVPFFGVTPTLELVRQSPADAVAAWWTATGMTMEAVVTLPQQLWNTIASLLSPASDDSGRSLVSVVGVGAMAGNIGGAVSEDYTLAMRTVDMLSLLASLNLALFVFNLIPLPPLDGGHIAGALAEGARRGVARITGRPDPGPVDTARLLPLAYGVIGLLFLMTFILVWADIAQPVF
ncbi:MAG TPA: site-2 protease family protein [Actinomycetaceae bacterium]|nr:site-2 protease family protein [Actinomycetaceae bacterium]